MNNKVISKVKNEQKYEDERNSELLSRQSAMIEKEIMKVKDSRQGRVGQIFKMKESQATRRLEQNLMLSKIQIQVTL